MFTRITPQHVSNNSIRYSSHHSNNLAKLQRQISTGIRLEKPSDAPADMADLLSSKELVRRIETDLKNISVAKSVLNQGVTQLTSAKNAITRAKSLALDGVQSVEKEALADDINGILNLLVDIGNATDGVSPLFSGVAGGRPFEISGYNNENEATGVTYVGDDQRSSIAVGRELYVDAFYSGSEVFQPQDRGETVFAGDTGAKAGTGTDTQIGSGSLLIRHTNTVYAAGSGLQASASSPGFDSIIGSHELTVDGVGMTIQLDGGAKIPFTGAEASLEVSGLSGNRISIDTTGFTPGFSGTVALTGEGVMSMDGGTTEVPIDFTDNQVIQDPNTGRVTYVDTTEVRQAGLDYVEFTGTADVFETLIQLRDDLRNTRDLPPGEWEDAMQRRIGDLTRVHDHILTVVGRQSVALENLEGMERRSEDYQLEMAKRVDSLESTDMIAAITNLQNEQNMLQYTYAVSANLMNGANLLDYIQ